MVRSLRLFVRSSCLLYCVYREDYDLQQFAYVVRRRFYMEKSRTLFGLGDHSDHRFSKCTSNIIFSNDCQRINYLQEHLGEAHANYFQHGIQRCLRSSLSRMSLVSPSTHFAPVNSIEATHAR